jgi:hypothetical protein
MPTNVSDRVERPQQLIVPLLIRPWVGRCMRNNASEIASSVRAKRFLVLEQGAKRQGNPPLPITLGAGRKRAGVSQGVAPMPDEFGLAVERMVKRQCTSNRRAWQPPISNLSHRDASDRASLPFPVSESWSKLLSFEHLMYSDARVERVAVCPLVFLDLRLACATAMRGTTSVQVRAMALVLPQ